jgi:WD40 repeat protein
LYLLAEAEKDTGMKGEGTSPIETLAVSPDGQWLASADLENRIHIFNLDTLTVRYHPISIV